MNSPGLKSWRTTAIGVCAAIVIALGTNGVKMPETKQDWWGLLLAVLAAVMGYLTRDAPVTSEMSGVSRSKANLEAIAKEEATTQLRMSVDPAAHEKGLREAAAHRVLNDVDATPPEPKRKETS